jgi:hypothetical protein
MISSPGSIVAASDRLTWSVSEVMFAPKVISSGPAAPNMSAAAACASSAIASDRMLVGNGPPALAFVSR